MFLGFCFGFGVVLGFFFWVFLSFGVFWVFFGCLICMIQQHPENNVYLISVSAPRQGKSLAFPRISHSLAPSVIKLPSISFSGQLEVWIYADWSFWLWTFTFCVYMLANSPIQTAMYPLPCSYWSKLCIYCSMRTLPSLLLLNKRLGSLNKV